MAEIIVPPSMNSVASFKQEPIVETAEIQPDDDEPVIESEVELNRRKRPGKNPPVTKPPTKDIPVNILPYPNPPTSRHPIFVPGGTTLDNVATHMLCNDWFVQNVRELVEEYKNLQRENRSQAIQIGNLDRQVADLRLKLQNVTEERDEYKSDYEAECAEHQRTRDALNRVRGELADLYRRYDLNLAELKRAKALLSEAVRENNRLKVDLADKIARIEDLEEKLRISNASEDAANEKVTELQRCIYELEREKTDVEKMKDTAEREARQSRDSVRKLENTILDLNRQIRNLKNGRRPTPGGPIRTFGAEGAEENIEEQETSGPSFEALEAPATPEPAAEAQAEPQAEEHDTPSSVLTES